MRRRFASIFALTLLISSPPVASLDVDGLIDPAEVDCLLRPSDDGVRWYWDGTYCVGLVIGRLEE